MIHGRGSAPLGVPLRIGLRPEKLLVTAAAAGDHANTAALHPGHQMELGDQVQLVAELPGGRRARGPRATRAGGERGTPQLRRSGRRLIRRRRADPATGGRARNRHPRPRRQIDDAIPGRDPHAGPAHRTCPPRRAGRGCEAHLRRPLHPGRAARAGAGLGGLALAFPGIASAAPAAKIENDLVIYNWSQYDDPSTYKNFKKAHPGPQDQRDVLLVERRADREAQAGGGGGYDIVVPSQNAVGAADPDR